MYVLTVYAPCTCFVYVCKQSRVTDDVEVQNVPELCHDMCHSDISSETSKTLLISTMWALKHIHLPLAPLLFFRFKMIHGVHNKH